MNEQDALLSAISAHPDDDTARLVYADWLDEYDDAPRAEFIRVQIALARDDGSIQPEEFVRLKRRERELLAAHQEEWTPKEAQEFTQGVERPFRRGFLDTVRIEPGLLVDERIGKKIMEIQPPPTQAQLVVATNQTDWHTKLDDAQWLQKLSALELIGLPSEAQVDALSLTPNLRNVVHLKARLMFSDDEFMDASDLSQHLLQELLNPDMPGVHKNFQHLQTLDLHQNDHLTGPLFLSDEQRLSLKTLNIGDVPLDHDVISGLLEKLPNLTALTYGGGTMHNPPLRPETLQQYLGKLKRLTFCNFETLSQNLNHDVTSENIGAFSRALAKTPLVSIGCEQSYQQQGYLLWLKKAGESCKRFDIHVAPEIPSLKMLHELASSRGDAAFTLHMPRGGTGLEEHPDYDRATETLTILGSDLAHFMENNLECCKTYRGGGYGGRQ